MFKRVTSLIALLTLSASVSAAPVFMSNDWAGQACSAWNEDDGLTTGLAGDWISNDAGRGYKVIQIYRTDCPGEKKVELTIVKEEGKAKCSYGGPVEHQDLNKDRRRQMVLEKYHVLAYLGDNLGDFPASPKKSAKDKWGAGYFIFPNPTYGPWLDAAREEPEKHLDFPQDCGSRCTIK